MPKLTLGIDSSSSKTGVALFEGKTLKKLKLLKSNMKLTKGERLLEFREQLSPFFPVDVVVIEKVSKSRNLNTVRMLAYWEAIAIALAAEWGIEAHSFSPSFWRKKAYGKNLTKHEIYLRESKKYASRFKGIKEDKGGDDLSDSIGIARSMYG